MHFIRYRRSNFREWLTNKQDTDVNQLAKLSPGGFFFLHLRKNLDKWGGGYLFWYAVAKVEKKP